MALPAVREVSAADLEWQATGFAAISRWAGAG
jgi:hypothetical protein